jgi:hypothetical protein
MSRSLRRGRLTRSSWSGCREGNTPIQVSPGGAAARRKAGLLCASAPPRETFRLLHRRLSGRHRGARQRWSYTNRTLLQDSSSDSLGAPSSSSARRLHGPSWSSALPGSVSSDCEQYRVLLARSVRRCLQLKNGRNSEAPAFADLHGGGQIPRLDFAADEEPLSPCPDACLDRIRGGARSLRPGSGD